jgi:hypothetical protein
MTRRALTLLATCFGALACAAIAIANEGSATDPSGDVKHNPPGKDSRYDIVKVTYGHTANGDLVQTVKVKGKVISPTSTSGAPPLLWIDVPGKVASRAGCNYSDYFVLDGEVDECGDGPKTGDATVTKLGSHTLVFQFSPAAIGSPAKYGIAFVEEGSNAKGNGLVFFDRAPDKGFARHKLQ